jgi:hypothetical protein
VCGIEKWELFLAVPKGMEKTAGAIHRDICDALIQAELITLEAKSKLTTLPTPDFFTRY